MSYKEYKCPRCGRVHAAISLADAEEVVGAGGDISPFFRCFTCPTPSAEFVPAGPDDAPVGRTLTVVVVPGAWPESAAELLDALQQSPPRQVNLFGTTCSLEETSAVLTAHHRLQAARDLMTKRLNEIRSIDDTET